MLRTLHTLEEQTQDEQIKEAVAGLRADVEAGSTLEQAMERHPEVFDRLFRAMVRSGEESGRLEDALDRIAFQVEKTDALRRQVKSALMYPALVFGFAVVVLVAIVAFIIPVFVGIFEELGEENPEEEAGAAAADPDLRHRPPTRSPATGSSSSRRSSISLLRLLQVEEDRTRQGDRGTASCCGSRSRSAT